MTLEWRKMSDLLVIIKYNREEVFSAVCAGLSSICSNLYFLFIFTDFALDFVRLIFRSLKMRSGFLFSRHFS